MARCLALSWVPMLPNAQSSSSSCAKREASGRKSSWQMDRASVGFFPWRKSITASMVLV